MSIINSREKGQVLVILVIALIGLLGFTSLGIDLGMIYSDRRYAQNAADAAAISGAQAASQTIENLNIKNYEWNCTTVNANLTQAYTAAISRAISNDFTISADTTLGTPNHDHGVNIICDQAGKFLDIHVMLSRVTSTSFVHLFNGGQMRNTVSATTRVFPGLPAGNGDIIVSLSKQCGNNTGGVLFSGNTEAHLMNGGVWSNSCIEAKSNTDVFITSGSVDYYHTSYATGFTNPVPIPQTTYHTLTNRPIPSPGTKCASSTIDSYDDLKNFSGPLTPGNYKDWDFKGNVTLSAGLYCVSGTVSMNSGVNLSGTGITIYYTGTSFTINGGMDAVLAAPDSPSYPPVNNAVEDLLLYIPPGIQADVKINGTSGSYFGGTIYAPDSLVFIAGNATEDNYMEMDVAIIGYDIDLTGATYLNLFYKKDKDWGWPSSLQVQR